MSTGIYLSSPASTSTTSLSSADPDSLPFPKPLNRGSFLEPSFSPATFLSTLTNRFQTLEDLRAELATLSQTIERELVDLVNDNYSDFLNLGTSLQGGEERIEEVRVGLLGFERDVKGLREKVNGERVKVAELIVEKKRLMTEVNVGRGLLEIDRRLGELEADLGLKAREEQQQQQQVEMVEEGKGSEEEEDEEKGMEDAWGAEWDDADLDEDNTEYEEQEEGAVPPRLRRKIEKFLGIKVLCDRFDNDHPFLAAEQVRIKKVKETVLLDIDAAIRAEINVKGKQAILQLRSEIDG